MATLYDLELQESNNFIHALMKNGDTPASMLMADQRKMAETMGDAGKEILAQLDDPNTDIGKSVKRLNEMKTDIIETMKTTGMTAELAVEAQDIFNKNPESLTALNEDERSVINTFWLKKKTCIILLLQKGYNHEELFS
jgi:hypothetical protein